MAKPQNVLILSQSTDVHSITVQHVMQMMGHRSYLINLDKIMQSNEFAIHYNSDGSVALSLLGFDDTLESVASTWTRRIPPPSAYAIPSWLSKPDEGYVKKNFEHCVNGVLSLLDERFPVNPSGVLYTSANKAKQLWMARQCGLQVPETLISNNSDHIYSFIASNEEVCVKPYSSHSWRTDTGIAVVNNARITLEDARDRGSLEVMPHIYQRFIKKRAEYRLTIFGKYAAATKIRTNELDENSAIDWRASMDYLSKLEFSELDFRIVEACQMLLRKLGLRFGTLDLAEDYDGNIYFLEVNQAGQWLWQEQHCPDCVLLEPFARFLASADDNFTWDKANASREFSAEEVLTALISDEAFQNAVSPLSSGAANLFQTDERTPAQSPTAG